MQPTDRRLRNDAADALDRPPDRRILAQSEMRSRRVVVGHVVFHDPAEGKWSAGPGAVVLTMPGTRRRRRLPAPFGRSFDACRRLDKRGLHLVILLIVLSERMEFCRRELRCARSLG
jgi:hypothetical protein